MKSGQNGLYRCNISDLKNRAIGALSSIFERSEVADKEPPRLCRDARSLPEWP